MRISKIVFMSILIAVTTACTTYIPIQMTPPLSNIMSNGLEKKPIGIGYIPPSVNKEVSLNKKEYHYYGVSSTFRLSPYKDSTPPFKKVLSNIFIKITPFNSYDSFRTSSEDLIYLASIQDIKTDVGDPKIAFGLPGVFKDGSQSVTISFLCKIVDRKNNVVWEKEITGIGQATKDEVDMGGDSLAPSRAMLEAFKILQDELYNAELGI